MDVLATTTEQETTGSGTLPEGFLFASVKNVGTEDATVNGVTLSPGEAKSYPFVGKGYRSFSYDAGGSRLRILSIS